MKKKIPILLLIALVLIQLIPISKENPKTDPSLEINSDSTPVLTASNFSLLKAACYDCHSNDTEYPGYTRFQPLGWWVKGHVKAGREKLNFSTWNQYSDKEKIKHSIDCVEVMENGRMPLKSYVRMHPKAQLSESQQKELLDLFEALGS